MIFLKRTFASICVIVLAAGCAEREAEDVATASSEAMTPGLVEEAYTWGLPIVAMYRYYDLIMAAFVAVDMIQPNEWFDTNGPRQPSKITLGDFIGRNVCACDCVSENMKTVEKRGKRAAHCEAPGPQVARRD